MLSVVLAAVLNGGVLLPVVMLTVREAHRIAPARATALIAYLTASFGVGQILGPLLAGYVAAHTGDFRGALVAAEIALLFGCVFYAREGRAAK